MNEIKINGLNVYACHGVTKEEKLMPQLFIFDVTLHLSLETAGISDDLTDTVNYAEVCQLIIELTKSTHYNLIERLARNVAVEILKYFPKVHAVNVVLKKPQAPLGCTVGSVAVSVTVEKNVAYLSLGSSLGNKRTHLDKMVEMINEIIDVDVEKVSEYFETEPYGGVAKNKFLNCAVKINTCLSPRRLLEELHVIEEKLGRNRKVRWDDRTADIDIIFFGDKTINEPDLIIPHPEWNKRDFVKIALNNLEPDKFAR